MDIKEIQNLIKFVQRSGVEEVKIERNDFKITIKTKSVSQKHIIVDDFQTPATIPSNQPITQAIQEVNSQETPEPNLENDNQVTIKSPIIGTFYRKSSPDKPPLVEVGQSIEKGDILCVIEAMKLFNEIESDFSGKIVKILVDDQSPVEFDQPLFIIDPS
ncbi:MAG: acetyl-CoA carboxylase biotin carboxyl carrier protein [Bacteroidetes bacterium]|nr:acetyl-CoA carboxylase biotin carboxyl carrier protein [Flavobacteriaceae bacterium]MDA0331226.1 acetyl-CoA carboxylase biotin carboxyl carrier protein [Bacteroidota bacterium]MDA0885263.1 acetyl-CoA carboxylase biotin carboxyl carrier protein [Bacteroidota bacterium]MDA1225845.1 acetyl-CoA carboxylase biotin carboxyl carrier protein [Bacteroidota bacterium]